MRRAALLAAAIALVACHGDEPHVTPVARPSELPPVENATTFERTGVARTRDAIRRFDEVGAHLVDRSDDAGGARLFIEEGRRTDHGYVATKLVIGALQQGTWAPVYRCTGTGTLDRGRWTFELGGPEACGFWNGTFRDPDADLAETVPDEPPAADVLAIRVPPPTTPFAAALADADRIVPGDAHCSVRLRHVQADVASGDDPGLAAARHLSAYEASGAPFELIHARSGVELPRAPESQDRYQVVYVRTAFAEPTVDLSARTFGGGWSRGRALLVDTTEGRIACAGDIEARTGDAIRVRRLQDAPSWLSAQLELAEEREIAIRLRVAVTAPSR